MLKALEWIDRMVAVILRPVVFAGMIALAAVITLQIVSRVFFTSFAWTEEVARFLLIWIAFLGAALAFQQGRHIAVTFVRDLMPLNLRRIITGAGILVAIAFLVTLAMIGWKYSGIQSFQRDTGSGGGHRRQHQYRNWPLLHDLAQRRDAIHHRHFKIHGDDIRLQRLVHLHSLLAVTGYPHNFQLTVGIDNVCDPALKKRRIIYHQDFDRHRLLRLLMRNYLRNDSACWEYP